MNDQNNDGRDAKYKSISSSLLVVGGLGCYGGGGAVEETTLEAVGKALRRESQSNSTNSTKASLPSGSSSGCLLVEPSPRRKRINGRWQAASQILMLNNGTTTVDDEDDDDDDEEEQGGTTLIEHLATVGGSRKRTDKEEGGAVVAIAVGADSSTSSIKEDDDDNEEEEGPGSEMRKAINRCRSFEKRAAAFAETTTGMDWTWKEEYEEEQEEEEQEDEAPAKTDAGRGGEEEEDKISRHSRVGKCKSLDAVRKPGGESSSDDGKEQDGFKRKFSKPKTRRCKTADGIMAEGDGATSGGSNATTDPTVVQKLQEENMVLRAQLAQYHRTSTAPAAVMTTARKSSNSLVEANDGTAAKQQRRASVSGRLSASRSAARSTRRASRRRTKSNDHGTQEEKINKLPPRKNSASKRLQRSKSHDVSTSKTLAKAIQRVKNRGEGFTSSTSENNKTGALPAGSITSATASLPIAASTSVVEQQQQQQQDILSRSSRRKNGSSSNLLSKAMRRASSHDIGKAAAAAGTSSSGQQKKDSYRRCNSLVDAAKLKARQAVADRLKSSNNIMISAEDIQQANRKNSLVLQEQAATSTTTSSTMNESVVKTKTEEKPKGNGNKEGSLAKSSTSLQILSEKLKEAPFTVRKVKSIPSLMEASKTSSEKPSSSDAPKSRRSRSKNRLDRNKGRRASSKEAGNMSQSASETGIMSSKRSSRRKSRSKSALRNTSLAKSADTVVSSDTTRNNKQEQAPKGREQQPNQRLATSESIYPTRRPEGVPTSLEDSAGSLSISLTGMSKSEATTSCTNSSCNNKKPDDATTPEGTPERRQQSLREGLVGCRSLTMFQVRRPTTRGTMDASLSASTSRLSLSASSCRRTRGGVNPSLSASFNGSSSSRLSLSASSVSNFQLLQALKQEKPSMPGDLDSDDEDEEEIIQEPLEVSKLDELERRSRHSIGSSNHPLDGDTQAMLSALDDESSHSFKDESDQMECSLPSLIFGLDDELQKDMIPGLMQDSFSERSSSCSKLNASCSSGMVLPMVSAAPAQPPRQQRTDRRNSMPSQHQKIDPFNFSSSIRFGDLDSDGEEDEFASDGWTSKEGIESVESMLSQVNTNKIARAG